MLFKLWPFLVFLLAIPFFYRLWLRRKKSASLRYPLPIPSSARTKDPNKFLLLLRCLGIAFILIALARPQSSHPETSRKVQGIDIMMVMDVSASMNIEDLSELPRLEIAKNTMRDFVKGRGNDRIGFIVFSGEAVTLSPPTLDYGLVLKSVGDAQTGVLQDGTAIGDGLALAVSRLKESRAKSRVIILLTDGDNNVGQVDPATAGELAAGFGIRTYTIAIGREGRVRLPIRQKIGSRVITSYQWFENALNPKLLKQIAEMTDGKFYRVTDATTLNKVFQEIDTLEKTELEQKEKVRYEEEFQFPLQIAFALLLFEQFLALGVLRWSV